MSTIMKASDTNRELGEAAVRLKMLTPEQLEAALQNASSGSVDGELFVKAGLLTEKQLHFLKTVQDFKMTRKADTRFGQMAEENGWVSREQVEHLLKVQKAMFTKKKRAVPLGELMIHEGLINHEQRDSLLQAQGRHPSTVTDDDAATKSASGIQVTISPDRLKAYLQVQEGANAPTLDELQTAIRQHGISAGIDMAVLSAIAAGEQPALEPQLIAEGTPPKPAVEGHIEYKFETNPLTAGRETEGGLIDFKDRGDIPQVDAGVVLAVRTPAQEGDPGKDVYGQVVVPPKPREAPLVVGNGAALSADKLSVVASVAGHPSLSATGTIGVFPEYRVDGDVGYDTGHIDFKGHVLVKGMVQEGFKIHCGQLTAKEIEGATVEAEGEVMISGGVIRSKVKSGGSIKVKYLHNTRVEVMGDVIVEREIVDSHIECSGKLHAERAKAIGSYISAKHGVFLKEVGTESSTSCTVVFGVDERVQNELQAIAKQVEALEEQQETLNERIGELQGERGDIDIQIGELAQVQDRGMVKQRELAEAQQAGEMNAAEVERAMTALQREAQEAETALNALFERQDVVNGQLDEQGEELTALQAEVEELNSEAEGLRQWSEENPGTAEVKANYVVQGTRLQSNHNDIKLSGDRKNMWLKEQEVTDDKGRVEWRLQPVS